MHHDINRKDFPLIGNFLVDDLEFEDENGSTSATANKPDDSRPPPIVDFEIEAVVLQNPPDLSFTSTSAGIIIISIHNYQCFNTCLYNSP